MTQVIVEAPVTNRSPMVDLMPLAKSVKGPTMIHPIRPPRSI